MNNAVILDLSSAVDPIRVSGILGEFGFVQVLDLVTNQVDMFNLDVGLMVTTGAGNDAFDLIYPPNMPADQPLIINGGGGFNTAAIDFSYPFSSPTTVPLTFVLDQTPGAVSSFGGASVSLTNIQAVAITSGDGDDVLTGGDFNDILAGGRGSVGGSVGGAPGQVLSGGGGDDVLSGGGLLFGDAGDDTLTSGFSGIKVIPAGAMMVGGLGDDTLIGNGTIGYPGGLILPDGYAVYDDLNGHVGATGAVTVDLNLTGPQNTVGAGVDTLVNVSGVIGTRWGDTLRGGFQLIGGDGDDTLSYAVQALGGGGDDTFVGVDEVVYYGAFSDYRFTRTASGVTVADQRVDTPDGTDLISGPSIVTGSDFSLNLAIGANDALSTGYGAPVTVAASALTANDALAPIDIQLISVSNAQHGTVAFDGANVTFTPYLGFVGQASFSYLVFSDAIYSAGMGVGIATVTVNVAGPGDAATAPAYIYRAGATAAETWDFTGDGGYHQLLTGSGYTTVYAGSGGSSVRLGSGGGEVIGGAGKDVITFGAGLDTATGGAGKDVFILTAGALADPTLTGGLYDTVTDFTGAGQVRAPDGDFIYFKGFNKGAASIVYEGDLAGDPTAHLYRITDGVHIGEFVLDYVGAGVNLAPGQFGFL